MHVLSVSVILLLFLVGSINVASATEDNLSPTLEKMTDSDTATNTPANTKKNKYYNVYLRRRSHTTKEFYAYVEKIRGMHLDPKKPTFKANIVRVLLNMKLITIKNPSKKALAYFESHRDIVDTVSEEENDIEAEL